MADSLGDTTEPDFPIFRPSKKRKLIRKREVSASPPPHDPTIVNPSANLLPITGNGYADSNATLPAFSPPDTIDPPEPSVAEIIRQRKLQQRRRGGGIEFSADSGKGHGVKGAADADGEVVPMKDAQAGQPALDFGSRFTKQTGLVKDTMDRHMSAYVESALARRDREATLSSQATQQLRPSAAIHPVTFIDPPSTAQPPVQPPRNPATLGKLTEIDLGTEARARNEAATARAARKLAAGEDGLDAGASSSGDEGKKKKKPPRVRIGRNGKPVRPRAPRNRRNSADLARDRIVDQVLRENKVDLAPHPPPPPVSSTRNEDDEGEADERVAEEFRREYLDAQAAGQNRRPVAAQQGGALSARAAKEQEKSKGPKLGGSRSVRAAIREKEKGGRK